MGNCCNICNKEDEPEKKYSVSWWQYLICAFSLIFHICDVGTDINLAVQYYLSDRPNCFTFTITIVIVACIIGTIFSIRMYEMDKDDDSIGKQCVKRKVMIIFMFFVPFVPILRYIDITRFAWKCRKAKEENKPDEQERNYKLMVREDTDMGVLRILEGFLEAAPQQILQITILLVDYNEGATSNQINLSQGVSILFSFLSMAWVVVTYHRNIRLAQNIKNNLSWIGTGIQFMWHILVIVSRIMAISMLASLYSTYTVIGLFLHSVVISLWLSYNEKWSFCNYNKYYDSFLYMIFGLVYIFTFFSMSDGRTRNKYIPYYVLCVIENIAIACVWYFMASSELHAKRYFIPLIFSTIVPFICGLGFMFLYYKYFHPNVLKEDEVDENQLEAVYLNSEEHL